MKLALHLMICLVALAAGSATSGLQAAVIVIANRTEESIRFEVTGSEGQSRRYGLQPGESQSLLTARPLKLRITDRGALATYELRPYAIYFFGRRPEGLTFEEIGFSTPLELPQTDDASEAAAGPERRAVWGEVKVKLYLDDELYRGRDPEPRVRRRVEAASAIFEEAAGVRFEIAGVDHWDSIDGVSDFQALMVDFERKVPVEPGVLAIGFSTQASRSKVHMGGTRLPLHSHVLVRERGHRQLSERAQLELLIHELGHFLGAAHSGEWSSAMRPRLGDGLADRPDFRIGLDPVNTMIVGLIGEEIRSREIQGLWELSAETKARLRPIYTDLAKALPNDPAAKLYLAALALTSAPPERPNWVTPLAEQARHIVQAVTLAAEENIQRPDERVAARFGQPHRLRGDALTAVYVRRAAAAAREVPDTMRIPAFAIGLAVALDNSTLLRDQPLTRTLWRSIESDREYHFRRAVLGEPTIRGRYDLVQHFTVSAGLAALFGPRIAEAAGVWKERTDGTFSRSDYAADLAGIRFFERLTASPERLSEIAAGFEVADYIPECSDTNPTQPQSTSSDSVNAQDQMRAEILKEIEALPAYAVDRAAK